MGSLNLGQTIAWSISVSELSFPVRELIELEWYSYWTVNLQTRPSISERKVRSCVFVPRWSWCWWVDSTDAILSRWHRVWVYCQCWCCFTRHLWNDSGCFFRPEPGILLFLVLLVYFYESLYLNLGQNRHFAVVQFDSRHLVLLLHGHLSFKLLFAK